MNTFFKTMAFLLVSNQTMASYGVHIPLEIKPSTSETLPNYGYLPAGSIHFGDGTTTPSNPTTPTYPAEPNCYFDDSMSDNFSAYIDLNGDPGSEAIYHNQYVINGTKGALQYTQNGYNYSEICFGIEGPIVKPVEEQWIADDCRYNLDSSTGSVYYWKEVAGRYEYADRQAFTNAVLGSLGEITYQTAGLYFPPGYINTSYGQIQPEDNPMIGRYSVYFYRGNFGKSVNINGILEYYYGVCKMTTN